MSSPKRRKGKKPVKGKQKVRTGRKRKGQEVRDLDLGALRAIVERAQSGPLDPEERQQLVSAIETLAFLTQEIERKGARIDRLRRLLFGPHSEKTRDVLGRGAGPPEGSGSSTGKSEATGSDGGAVAADAANGDQAKEDAGASTERGKKKSKGHGRNGAAAYTGAKKVIVPNDALKHGDRCPACERGKVYRMAKPAVLVRVRGVAPLDATVYELERLRCNLCGEVFTAREPPGVGEAKYDETAAAMLILLKYGCGLPFNRIEHLGRNLGMPLPASTQWDVVGAAVAGFEPIWAELIRQAAAGEVVGNDDTKNQVLSLAKEIKAEEAAGQAGRTGIFTSSVVSTVGERQIATFFTGRKHAGENLAQVLAHRPAELPLPIQMCDALSRNTSPDELKTIVANCLAHARRQFVDLAGSFPDEVAHVLDVLGAVYRHDAQTRERGMSSKERLAYHKEHSGPLMDELKEWCDGLLASKKVEPNSSLGSAIRYLDNHWQELTLFLREPSAPLDNNLCERVLKRAILHRKNSLFFKTENGAHAGDMFLSLIHTAELNGVNPFDYLLAVLRNGDAADAAPSEWLPWNYAGALARIASSATDAS